MKNKQENINMHHAENENGPKSIDINEKAPFSSGKACLKMLMLRTEQQGGSHLSMKRKNISSRENSGLIRFHYYNQILEIINL
jgi:hypothetical protein